MFLCFCAINWEKVPDWIQAFGAVIAAIGLVYTLLLQRKTLKEQQIITKLEQQKFLNSHLPILELSNLNYNKSNQDREITFDIAIKENYLQNLKITHNFPDDHKITIPHYISDVILPKNYFFILISTSLCLRYFSKLRNIQAILSSSTLRTLLVINTHNI